MRVRHIHLLDESGTIAAADLDALASALQVQIDRDFGPSWGVKALIRVGQPGEVTKTIWPLRIVDPSQLPPHAGGVHLDQKHKPYAIVGSFADYSVAASHELLEMLVDPYGRKLVAAPSLDPAAGERTVYYLVEVCDPCEVYSYSVAGVSLSDFVLQDFYNPGESGSVDHLDDLPTPFAVPKGCYISWYDPADSRWHQIDVQGNIITAKEESKLGAHPREERDQAFSDDENSARHDLAAVFRTFSPH